jgi:enterochelin esterase family protein
MANSPEYHDDGTVSFRIWAPKAARVTLESELLENRPNELVKGEDDMWSITLLPLKAGLYKYRFLVDGVITVDPTNSLTDGVNNLIFIKGDEADFYTARHVPHGSVHLDYYHSKSLGIDRPVHVYTPPGYAADEDRTYPVLFLFHGSGGTDRSWIDMGKANVILDNLIADGLAIPMIVVTPFGHTVEPGTSGWPFVQERGDFAEDFMNDLVPFVEEQYRVSSRAQGRALAGFSMGGYHTLKIGLKHLKDFDFLGVFSWGPNMEYIEENEPGFFDNLDSMNRSLQLLWIACGREDFLFRGVTEFDALLSERGVDHTFFVSEGGHSMTNWRRYLYDFAQLIFRDF